MNRKEIKDACVKWAVLVPVLILVSVSTLGWCARMIEHHTHRPHNDVPRAEYDQFTRLLLDRLDRIENKLDRLQ